MEVIKIRPMGRRNHLTFLLLAGLLGLVSLLAIGWSASLAVQLPLCLATLVCLVTAIGKRLEPPITLQLSPRGLTYRHRKGRWLLPWGNLQRIDRLLSPDDRTPLDYLGLRLRQPDHHYRAIQPRLALALMQEQRPLARLAQPHCQAGQCLNLLPDKADLPSPGLTGVRAAYATQQVLLRRQLGFDLYLPLSSLDRDPEDAVSLLRDYQLNATQVARTTTTE